MQVSWAEPDKNGDAIRGYRLEVLRGGKVVRTMTPGPEARSQAVVVDTSETPYTYRIQAYNKAGWGEMSAPSAPRRGVIAPGAPTSLKVSEGDRNLVLSYNPGSSGGASSSEISYQYRLNGSAWSAVPGNKTIGGLTNGANYTVEVRAVANVGGSTYAGAVSNAATGNPYGKPHAPTGSAAQLPTQVQLGWNANGSANGRSIQVVQISVDGGGWQNVGLTGSVNVGNGYNEPHNIRVRAMDTTQTWSDVSPTYSAQSGPQPQPRAWVTRGTPGNWPGQCTDGTCAKFVVNTTDFPAGNYRVWCNSNAPTAGPRFAGGSSWNIPANGSIEIGCFHGSGGRGYEVWVTIGSTDYEHRGW